MAKVWSNCLQHLHRRSGFGLAAYLGILNLGEHARMDCRMLIAHPRRA